MLRSLSMLVIAVALPLISQCPPTGVGGSSAVSASTIAQPLAIQTSTVSDPVGDTLFTFNAPFQDFVSAQMTKTAAGNYEMLMEMAAPVPPSPPMPPQANHQMWWFWIFDLDPTTRPMGYPWQEAGNGRPPEFIVYVSWDGTAFAGAAIDRRPLLTGGEAIVTPVPFSINGARVEAVLASELIGAVPTFNWGPFTFSWSGPVGSEGVNFADYAFEAGTIFNP
jgi:hypothetical protein